MVKLTRQGVRDLNGLPGPRREKTVLPLNCDHRRMRECCPGCGHFYCPGCGLTWDRGAEASLGFTSPLVFARLRQG